MSRLQFTIIIVICILLAAIIIVLGSRPRPGIVPPAAETQKEQPAMPQAKRFELTPKTSKYEARQEEKKLPDIDISDVALEDLPKVYKEPVSAESAGETGSASSGEPDKYRKRPTPEQLRDIKQKGLSVY